EWRGGNQQRACKKRRRGQAAAPTGVAAAQSLALPVRSHCRTLNNEKLHSDQMLLASEVCPLNNDRVWTERLRVIIIPSGLRLLMSLALRDPTQGIGVAIVCLGLPAATGSSHRSLRPSSTSPASSQASNGSSAASPISSLPDAAPRRLPRRCGHCWRRCKKLTHFTSVTAAASCDCSTSGRARRIKGSWAITARRRS